MSPLPTIAFFGATGGVTNSILIHALRNSTHVIALVRIPSKLTNLLTKQGITPSTISTYLTIIQGNALSIPSVITTLTANNHPNYIVPWIVTGLGAAPNFQLTPPFMTIDQPTLCGDAAKTLVSALKQIYNSSNNSNNKITTKPNLTFISTTGISSGPEDVPFGLRTLYHYILHTPHKDKRIMESTFRAESPHLLSTTATTTTNNNNNKNDEPSFNSVTGIRPTLLTGSIDVSSGKGYTKIRAGMEQNPVTGWFVNRADVGEWVWVNILSDESGDESGDGNEKDGRSGNGNGNKRWRGQMISLAG